jgi:hypothetical protein
MLKLVQTFTSKQYAHDQTAVHVRLWNTAERLHCICRFRCHQTRVLSLSFCCKKNL